jgi:hypothetical protein
MLSIALSLTCKWKYRRRERVELGRVLYGCLPSGERKLVEGGEGVDGVLLEPSSLSKRDETFVERLNSGIRRKAFKRVKKDKRQLGLLSLK